MLLATAEDCKEKSLKRLARDDDIASPLVSQSSLNKRQATSNKNFQEPENLKVQNMYTVISFNTKSNFLSVAITCTA